MTRRPFKEFVQLGPQGAQLQGFTQARPGHTPPAPTRRVHRELIQVGSARRSDFITTRCYSPTGRQIWDGDHGNTVFALAVASDGTVYQSGAGVSTASLLGPSLFPAGSGAPFVTAMRWGGLPIWCNRQSSSNRVSYGIAVGQDGFLYYGENNSSSFPPTAYVAKLRRSSGEDLLHLPDTNELIRIGTGRVKCDAAGNPYALGNSANILKWVNDVETWGFMYATYDNAFLPSGLDVTDGGDVFISRTGDAFGPVTTEVLYRLDSSTPNLPSLTAPTIVDSVTQVVTEAGAFGYDQVGCSRDGNQWVSYDIISQEITGTKTAAASPLGGSAFFPYTAMAVNNSGIYCYSSVRGVTGFSHVIRAADNSLIAELDHGGEIYDAVVLPNGNTIVAGDRVRRSDFP